MTMFRNSDGLGSCGLAELQDEIKRLREALEIIAGRRQCIDNLMSNQDVAIAVLDGSAAPSA